MELNKKELSRYDRHLILPEIGMKGQKKLKQSKVLVIGAGGLGCPVLQYLTAAGVGTIGIIDFDVVDESNLQRQVLFGVSSLGRNKAEVAKEKLSDINPLININTYPTRLTTENALDIFKEYDIIVDGTDNFATRYMVNDACVILDKTLVYGSIYRFEGQITVFNYTDKDGVKGPTYRCLFPTPPPPEAVPNCSEIGVIGVLPGIVGTLQANEAIKIITQIAQPLSGKLVLFDALKSNFVTINISRDENVVQEVLKNKNNFKQTDYEYFCSTSSNGSQIKEISPTELKQLLQKDKIQLIDVREYHEHPKIEALTDIQIPLREIEKQTNKIDKDKKVVIYCRSGARSAKAIKQLEEEFGFTNLYNLKGGVLGWQ